MNDDGMSGSHEREFVERRLSLSGLLKDRPKRSELAETGIIDDSGMAPPLQPVALKLMRRLSERTSAYDLQVAGILPLNGSQIEDVGAIIEQDDLDDSHHSNSQNTKLKHRKKDSLTWQDFKGSSSKGKGKGKELDHERNGLELNVGDRVQLTKNRKGTIRFIGKTHFSPDIRIGVELDDWFPNGHDGQVGNKRYFRCKHKYGIFVPETGVLSKLDDIGVNKTLKIDIGNKVKLGDGRQGTIRFIGKTKIVIGTLVGIELDSAEPNGNDGSLGGTKYFECAHKHGTFVKPRDVVKVFTKKELEEQERNARTIEDNLEIGTPALSNKMALKVEYTSAFF